MLRVEYKSQSFLFTADIREALEEELSDDFGDVDVLKLSHHGSDSANGEALLETNPDTVVVSASTKYIDDKEIIDEMRDRDTPIYITGKDGNLEFVVTEQGALIGPDEAVDDE
ncbi:hypothetical protein [Halostella pelagica]|uniref:hypothetical protein n=1 Tax=Halostella pelagica TaxID=2583824 RepID=UPI001081B7FD|nr:hypothetical protein [Halostella pelagica]